MGGARSEEGNDEGGSGREQGKAVAHGSWRSIPAARAPHIV
ncbi:Hypothetical protein A7982_00653 [Minicystis rosea]|nr:Hypothetical protein A7982_00653 [Minicystis rosea]